MAICAVIGLGQLGEAVAVCLAENGVEVIAIDSELDRVEAIKDRVDRALCLDATDERALRAAGVSECGTVVLALGEAQLEEAVLTTMLLRELGVGRIISRAGRDVQAKALERLGVSEVVFPEREMGEQIARKIISPTVRELIPLAKGVTLAELDVPKELSGKSLLDAQVRANFGLNVVAVRRRNESARDDGSIEVAWSLDNMPGPDTIMHAGDQLVVVGEDEQIQAFAGKE